MRDEAIPVVKRGDCFAPWNKSCGARNDKHERGDMKIILLNLSYIIIAPFLLTGLINRVKAIWSGRKGASLFQSAYDFIKLCRKSRVISTTATLPFKIAPVIITASVIAAAAIVPVFSAISIFSFKGDFILFIYLLALGKFFMILSATDTGSSFEGMGASRETLFSVVAEPAFFIMTGTLCALSGATSFQPLFAGLKAPGVPFVIPFLFGAALSIIAVTEGCRVPVDDPNTHLELTMIHEVMALDNSGPDMALITYASNLKMTLFLTLATLLFLPADAGLLISLAYFGGMIVTAAVVIGTVESVMARFRMTHVPQFIFIAASISLAALSVVMLLMRGGI